jgi:hypothetical protein
LSIFSLVLQTSCHRRHHHHLNSITFESQLEKVATEVLFPLLVLKEDLSTNHSRPQKDRTVGSTVEVAAQQKIDEVCAQNQLIAAVGSRKRDRSSQEQQCLRTTTATNEEVKAMYYSGNANDAAIVERRRKALKTTKDSCTATELRLQQKSCSSQTRSSHTRRKWSIALCEKTEKEAVITTNNKENPERHDPSEELTTLRAQEQSPSRSSKQSATARNNKNPSHATFVAKQRHVPALVGSSGMSHTKDPKIIESQKEPPLTAKFEKRIEELTAFKAKFGHCRVTGSKSASNMPYVSLGGWCAQLRYSRRSMEEGKPTVRKFSKAQIDRLDALGFPWTLTSPFEKHIEELKAFKAKFGHLNVTRSKSASNKPYVHLGNWCVQARRNRRLIDEGKPPGQILSKAHIERLDAIGFPWVYNPFDKHIEELKAFKAKFGHLNVTRSKCPSNKPYVSLADWCVQVRRSRKLVEEGKKGVRKFSKAQIDRLDALGFPWTVTSPFEKHFEELKAFKAKFGHCNVTRSKSASNKPYVHLADWCVQVRRSRRLTERKPGGPKLSKAQIERLDALGFPWVNNPCFEKHFKELKAFKAKFGHCNVTQSKCPSNKQYLRLADWCVQVRHSRRLTEEGKKPGGRKLSKAKIDRLDALGFSWVPED